MSGLRAFLSFIPFFFLILFIPLVCAFFFFYVTGDTVPAGPGKKLAGLRTAENSNKNTPTYAARRLIKFPTVDARANKHFIITI